MRLILNFCNSIAFLMILFCVTCSQTVMGNSFQKWAVEFFAENFSSISEEVIETVVDEYIEECGLCNILEDLGLHYKKYGDFKESPYQVEIKIFVDSVIIDLTNRKLNQDL
jgi:hypothetical protein